MGYNLKLCSLGCCVIFPDMQLSRFRVSSQHLNKKSMLLDKEDPRETTQFNKGKIYFKKYYLTLWAFIWFPILFAFGISNRTSFLRKHLVHRVEWVSESSASKFFIQTKLKNSVCFGINIDLKKMDNQYIKELDMKNYGCCEIVLKS